ncbi:MAG: TetR/AcrR family transcriptional regulator [Bacteroidales bacterium]|jgi:AcrR family transcriptional regulator
MELRARIIKETFKLLGTKSCKSITMDEIANNLGISKRTLYEQFQDKSALLDESLNTHFEKGREESAKIIETSENSLISFMLLMQKATKSMSLIGYDLMKDIGKYYPEIYNNTILKHINFFKDLSNKLIKTSLKQGLLLENIDICFLHNMLQLNLFYASQNEYLSLNPNYTSSFISNAHLFIIMRGVSTIKGIEIIDKYQDIFLK